MRPPGSIASTSVDLAIAALAEPARMRATVAELARARLGLATGLTELGMRVLPAATNFVLAEVGPRAKDLHAGLLDEGLVVRDFPEGSPLEYYLRFTVRTSRAHRRLLTSLEEQSK